jgi:hypothetical protein
MLGADHQLLLDRLRVGKDFRQCLYPVARHAGGVELVDPIIAAPVRQPLLDRRVHRPTVLDAQIIIVEPHRRHHPGAEIFNQHIGLRGQLFEHRASLGMAQIQGHGALVAVERREIPAEPVADRALPAHRVARARGFDLDDLRTHVAQQHRAERPGKDAGQVDHA